MKIFFFVLLLVSSFAAELQANYYNNYFDFNRALNRLRRSVVGLKEQVKDLKSEMEALTPQFIRRNTRDIDNKYWDVGDNAFWGQYFPSQTLTVKMDGYIDFTFTGSIWNQFMDKEIVLQFAILVDGVRVSEREYIIPSHELLSLNYREIFELEAGTHTIGITAIPINITPIWISEPEEKILYFVV